MRMTARELGFSMVRCPKPRSRNFRGGSKALRLSVQFRVGGPCDMRRVRLATRWSTLRVEPDRGFSGRTKRKCRFGQLDGILMERSPAAP